MKYFKLGRSSIFDYLFNYHCKLFFVYLELINVVIFYLK